MLAHHEEVASYSPWALMLLIAVLAFMFTVALMRKAV